MIMLEWQNGWEGDRGERLDEELLRDALADPELGDAAEWIWKLCMQVIAAVRCERSSLDAEFSLAAAALTVGGSTERRIGHAIEHFVRTALCHPPGQVPYLRRVMLMRRALATVRSELAIYWRAPSLYEASHAVRSLLHAIFQSRYPRATADWSAEVARLRDSVLEAIERLASEYAHHYDERKDSAVSRRPPQGGKGVSSFAGQTIRSIIIPRSTPQKYVVNGTEFVISGPKAIAVVDRLISAYESHEHAFVDLPRCWQSHFKRGGSSSFRQFIEYEFVNHRPTGRARLNVKV